MGAQEHALGLASFLLSLSSDYSGGVSELHNPETQAQHTCGRVVFCCGSLGSDGSRCPKLHFPRKPGFLGCVGWVLELRQNATNWASLVLSLSSG